VNGTITDWSAFDSIGRIRLDTGEEVRFGGTACRFAPVMGLAVRVLKLEPHRLGGQRAVAVELASPGDADSALDQRDPLPGLAGGTLEQFIELTDEVGLLGVLLKEPLRSRAAVRAWLARAGAEVDFHNARCPLVRVGQYQLRLWVCMDEAAGAKGIVSFSENTPFSVRRERELQLAATSLDPTSAPSDPRLMIALTQLVARVAAGEVAVIAHQAPGYLAPASVYAERAADYSLGVPLRAFTQTTTSRGGDLMLTGMAAVRLPDLFLREPPADLKQGALEEAAAALIALGRVPEVGVRLGWSTVKSADPEWICVGLN
jgi:hypothetical protein